jgi:hypothetical protein
VEDGPLAPDGMVEAGEAEAVASVAEAEAFPEVAEDLAEVVAADRGRSILKQINSMRYPHLFIQGFLICCAFYANAQAKKPAFQILIGPTLAGRYMDAPSNVRKTFNDAEKPVIRYDVGILTTVYSRSNIAFESGLIYSRKGFGYEFEFRDGSNQLVGKGSFRYQFDFIEIPMLADIYLSSDHHNFIDFGMLHDLRVGYNAKYTGDHPEGFLMGSPTFGKLKTYNVGFQAGYGHRLFQASKYDLVLEPNFKMQILRMNENDTPAKRYLFTIGLSARLRF